MPTMNVYQSTNMDDVSGWATTRTVGTATQMQYASGPFAQNYFGNGFNFDNPVAQGIVEKIEFYHDGVKLWDLTGSFSAGTIETFLNSGNRAGLQQTLFSGIDTLNGSEASDVLRGYLSGDTIFGNGGNDFLMGGPQTTGSQNDLLDGGAGVDTALYNTSRGASSVVARTPEQGGGFTVAGPEGTDTLLNMERIRFTDKMVALDIEGTAGQAYRIYQAAFDRPSDDWGLGYWIHDMENNGQTLLQVTNNFMLSEEFRQRYGDNITDEQFVTLLYRNVLDRELDQPGFDYWITNLQNGVDTRPVVLASFSESAENKANVIGAIQNGMNFDLWVG